MEADENCYFVNLYEYEQHPHFAAYFFREIITVHPEVQSIPCSTADTSYQLYHKKWNGNG